MGTSCSWNTGTGTLNQLGDTVTGIYNNPGSYSVRLTATLPDGTVCPVITQVMNLLPGPRATFAPSVAADTMLCQLGRSVTLVNTVPGIVNYEWFIDNQRFVTATGSYTHTFNATGCYTVILRIRDASGCEYTETKPNYICVYDTVGVALNMSVDQACIPFNATFQASINNNGNSIQSINWTFPGGTPATFAGATPPVVRYTSLLPNYAATVTVRTTAGCVYTKQLNFTASPTPPKPTVSATPLLACINSGLITFTNTTPGLPLPGTFTWVVPSGIQIVSRTANSLVVTSRTPGVYRIALEYTIGNCKTVSDSFSVRFQGIKANFGPAPNQQLTACQAPHSVTFNVANGSIAAGNVYTWLVPDDNGDVSPIPPVVTPNTSQTFTFADTGLYTIGLVVTDANGCRDTLLRANYVVIGSPVASFMLNDSSVCINDPVLLTSTTEPISFPYRRTWEISGPPGFAPVRFTSQRVTTRFFTIPGVYTIKHIVSNNGLCSDSVTKVNILTVFGVAATPTASTFTGCPNFTTNLSAGVTRNVPNSTITYSWVVSGPGAAVFTPSNTVANPALRFPVSGTYNVALIISNGSGCVDSIPIAQPFLVGLGGVINLDPSVCNNTPISASVQSSIITPTGYLWNSTPAANFLTPTNGPNVTVTFPTGGTYILRCVLSSGPPTNCNDTIRDTIVVREIQGDFIANQTALQCATPEQPELVLFTSTNNNGIVNYEWSFGDGSTAVTTLPSIPHLYQNNGSFSVRLVVTDSLGCFDTILKTNYINITGPQPRFTLNNPVGCDSVTVQFTDQTVGADTLYLDFDDGRGLALNPFNAANQASRTYVFPFSALPNDSAFTFRPKLFAVDILGCFTVFSDSITVWRKTEGDFSASTKRGCAPLSVSFDASGVRFDTLQQWDFNSDGTFDGQGLTPTFVYTQPGTYVVTLRASNGGGVACATLFTDTIVVLPLPSPSISPLDTVVCLGETAFFSDITQHDTTIVARRWTLPDGSTTSTPSVFVTVNTAGLFALKLVLTDANGCVDSLVLPAALRVSEPVGNIVSNPPAGSTLIGNTNRLNLQNTAAGAVTSIWLVDGREVARGANVNIDFTEENDNLFVTLISLNAEGCPDTSRTGPYAILLPQLNVTNVFTPNGDGINDTWNIQYRGTGKLAVKIVDRWGVEMFAVPDHLQEAWNGTTKSGATAPEGVYFYIVDDGDFTRSGQITLLR